jgi:sugar lactone lactonase YvrE
VSDSFDSRVLFYLAGSTVATRVYGQLGDFTTNIPNAGLISAILLNTPAGIATDASNGLLVADMASNRVVYYASGSTSATRVYGQVDLNSNAANAGGISATSLNAPQGVTVDATDNVYIADTANSRVLFYAVGSTVATRVYGQGGSFLTGIQNNIGAGGGPADLLALPNAVAVDSANNVYIADSNNNRVLFYTAGSTTATRVWGQGGSFSTTTINKGGVSADSLFFPGGVVVDASNNVYISDVGNSRVLFYPSGSTTATRVYGQSGSFTTGTQNNGGTSAVSLNAPTALLLDANNGLYVADTSNNRVLYYASGSTTASLVFGQGESFTVNNLAEISARSLRSPAGLARDKLNVTYISDQGLNRVLSYPCAAPSSSSTTSMTTSSNSTTAPAAGAAVRPSVALLILLLAAVVCFAK